MGHATKNMLRERHSTLMPVLWHNHAANDLFSTVAVYVCCLESVCSAVTSVCHVSKGITTAPTRSCVVQGCSRPGCTDIKARRCLWRGCVHCTAPCVAACTAQHPVFATRSGLLFGRPAPPPPSFLLLICSTLLPLLLPNTPQSHWSTPPPHK